MYQSKFQTKINVKLFSGKNKDFWKWKFHVEVIFELEDGSSGQTASTLHTWGGGRGKRGGAQKGPMYSTRRGRRPLPFFFWLWFDARPGGSRPANRWGCNSNSWLTIPPLPWVEFLSHFYQDWHKRDWDWGISKPKLAGQIFGNTGVFILHIVPFL